MLGTNSADRSTDAKKIFPRFDCIEKLNGPLIS